MTVADDTSTEMIGKVGQAPPGADAAPIQPAVVVQNEEELDEHILRFPVADRIEHIITIVSFTVLAVTGLPQMYAMWPIMIAAIQAMGGIETIRIIHRGAAIVLILASIWHIAAMGYKVYVKRVRLTMLPGWKDVVDAVQGLGYNFRILRNPPRMGKFNYMEKAEYWALVWGTVVMMVTGYMLWNPIATTSLLPGSVIPVARMAHGLEAVLAVLSILTWHMYHVHLKRFNKSMFSGYISREEMEEEHQIELELHDEGKAKPLARNKENKRRRARIYVPIAGVITAMLFLATFYFLTFEKTAITTIPPSDANISVPLTPTPPQVQ
jgi:cytochrome b subunit of formate dehydrogenase